LPIAGDATNGQAMIMLMPEALVAYALAGAIVAVAFVVLGLRRVVPHASVTVGARLLLLPGAVALWPLVLARWIKPRGHP